VRRREGLTLDSPARLFRAGVADATLFSRVVRVCRTLNKLSHSHILVAVVQPPTVSTTVLVPIMSVLDQPFNIYREQLSSLYHGLLRIFTNDLATCRSAMLVI